MTDGQPMSWVRWHREAYATEYGSNLLRDAGWSKWHFIFEAFWREYGHLACMPIGHSIPPDAEYREDAPPVEDTCLRCFRRQGCPP